MLAAGLETSKLIELRVSAKLEDGSALRQVLDSLR